MSESRDDGARPPRSPAGIEARRLRGWKTKPLVALPPREQTSRLTLDFSGPLLPLPSVPPDDVVAPPNRETVPRTGHDAWAVDRVRRSTPPPMQVRPGWLEQGLERGRKPSDVPPPHVAPIAPEGSAFDLVDHARPSFVNVDLHQEMADRFALGDFSGALSVAELILGTRGQDPAAQRYAEACREKLEQLYASRLGSFAARPRVVVGDTNVRWLGLDHRAGFLLSRVDGTSTVEEIIDTSGMPRLEALRTLCDLLDLRALELQSPPPATPVPRRR